MNRKNIYRALLVALVIGTVLNLINSYDVFMEGQFTNRNILRITLTYITPFVFHYILPLKPPGKQVKIILKLIIDNFFKI